MRPDEAKHKPWPPSGLYVLTAEVADLLPRAEQVLEAGAQALQYRDKSGNATLRLQQAAALRRLTARYGARLIINDDVELAAAVGADGVHLGRDDGPVERARRRLGPQAVVGVSCYDDLQRAARLAAAGADYLAFGRLFPSSTKPEAPSCPLDRLTQARAFGLPLVAIGGIHPANAARALAAGADWLAVSASVFLADDPAAATRALLRAWR